MSNEQTPSFIQLIKNVFNAYTNRLRHLHQLFHLDLHLFSQTLTNILLLGIIFSVLLIGTWLCILAGLVCAFSAWHLALPTTLAILIVLHLFLLGVVGFGMKRMHRNLGFNATRRHLYTPNTTQNQGAAYEKYPRANSAR